MDRLIAQAVFVAEDDEDDRYLLQLAFEEHSPECQLIFVKDGMDLLDALAMNPIKPCLIILDLNMPRLNGFEVLAVLRKNPFYETTPILILTTAGPVNNLQRAYGLGANEFITKPLHWDLLGQMVLRLRHHWHLETCY